MRRLITASILALLWLISPLQTQEARASSTDDTLLFVGLTAAGIAYFGTSIASVIVNSNHAKKGTASKGWVITGTVFGYTNLLIGIAGVVVGLIGATLVPEAGFVSLGSLPIVFLGVYGLIYAKRSASWGYKKEKPVKLLSYSAPPPRPQLMMSPILMRDSAGSMASGSRSWHSSAKRTRSRYLQTWRTTRSRHCLSLSRQPCIKVSLDGSESSHRSWLYTLDAFLPS